MARSIVTSKRKWKWKRKTQASEWEVKLLGQCNIRGDGGRDRDRRGGLDESILGLIPVMILVVEWWCFLRLGEISSYLYMMYIDGIFPQVLISIVQSQESSLGSMPLYSWSDPHLPIWGLCHRFPTLPQRDPPIKSLFSFPFPFFWARQCILWSCVLYPAGMSRP